MDAIADVASDGVRAATGRLTDEPTNATDDWGRDPLLVRNMMLFAQLRWDVATGGDQRLPRRAGALVVVNAPSWSYSTVFTAFAISEAIDRPVRFVGRSDIPVIHSFDRRIGGLLDHPDEVSGALRSDEIVVLGVGTGRGSRSVGGVDHTIVGRGADDRDAGLSRCHDVEPVLAACARRDRHADEAPSEAARSAERTRTRRPDPQRHPGPARRDGRHQHRDAARLAAPQWDRSPLMTYVRSDDGTRIHYSKTGNPKGAPILFIQGLGAGKAGWALQRLATAPWYQAIALDNRGAGRSDKPHGAYTLEQMADDAIAVLDHAGIETAHVVGASMGGAISQILAVKYPERTRSVTLACTAGTNHPWREELLTSWKDNALEGGMGAMSTEAVRWVIGPRSFRRFLPAMGWLGPLALGRPLTRVREPGRCHPHRRRIVCRRRRRHRGPGARPRRQPGHPHASRRQRGARGPDPHGGTRRDLRRRPRLHDRARDHLQSGSCSSSSVAPKQRGKHAAPRPAPTCVLRDAPGTILRENRTMSKSAMRVVIVGAGMSGLVAAQELVAAGVEVAVVDKGRSVGGRLATRRIGDARLDHGAQFFTVRTPAFQRRVDQWLDRGDRACLEPRIRRGRCRRPPPATSRPMA